ncbi:hypothetical protein [Methylibium petroleiphilum]|uniref:Uncharacterized protein n=1 Tax=Methylibium petroleiphilum (strain ATCC BAA-1232 / LMG 22953 / PM1) TaxID=420662 RepID=A2SBX7_METPP|nr:hypothetical protein [Methylibium petroleiphilum]ABM93066.1 hypothetical protein Mpe_A0104 [Methylibium petroleiphilum PM1]
MNRPHPPEPAGDDDVARDAHLRAALRHAPDRDARPPAELSRRILDAARVASGSAPKKAARPAAAPWARVRDGFASCTAWLRHPGATAAFASLMLATVIGVMWRDGPPPETEPVHDGAAPAGPSTAPSASTTAADPAADRPPAHRDVPAETAADAAARDTAAITARRADNDDGGRREAAAPRPRTTGPAPSGPPAGKAAAQEKRIAAPEAANPPAAASPPPTPMAASPAAPAVTPSERSGAAAQNQTPLGATAERSGRDDRPSAQAAPPDDPLAAPIAALRGSGGDAPARLARRDAATAVAPSSAAGMPPSALAWFGDAQALTRGRWRPVAATSSAALPTAWTEVLSTDGRPLGRVAILEGALWWQPAGTDGRIWRAPLPAGDAAQRLAATLASGALDRSPPP